MTNDSPSALRAPTSVPRPRTVVTVAVAVAISAALVFAATRYARSRPAMAVPAAGMRVHVDEGAVTLDRGAPQWMVLKVGAAVVARAHWTDPLTARVRIDERNAARIGSPLAGQVTDVFVELGQRVTKGQALFRVMSGDIAGLRSDAAKASADLDVARAEYQRVHDMVKLGLAPGKDELMASARRRQAELSLGGAEARLRALRVATRNDNEFTVTAPRAGIVVEKNLLPAQEVSADGALIQIADVGDVWVVADVFESDAAGLAVGTPSRVTTPAWPGFSAEVPVASVSAVVDPVRHTVQVKARLANAAGILRPNGYADVRFRMQIPPRAVEVAATAVVSDGATQYVYVEASPGHFIRRSITAGPVRDGNVIVNSGLRVGERVVQEGGILLDNQLDIAR